jgi:BirA family transcriptional regulator, biotin operon repressor / biotin---[acetyl-CoA-carboxylase] ligase
VAVSDDLSAGALADAVPGRPLRTYPALLSTDADAVAWARAGAPAGAVVVADYQASARGRGGLPWTARPGRDLCFSLVLRPAISADDEGWLFVAAALAVLEVVGGDATVEWPDRVLLGERVVADVAGHAGLGADGVAWAIVNLILYDVQAPRGPLIARLAEAVERVQLPHTETLARFRERCATIGRAVVAHVIPTWPDGVQIAGTALSVLEDGALVIERADGSRIAVRPQHLARLEPG